jgi:hypothetical protein
MVKKVTRTCTSTVVVSPYSSSFTPSTSSAMKTPENTEEDQKLEEISKWNTPLISCAAHV